MPGKKAEALAGFDRRARQDDARDLLVDQRGDGHRDGEIGLAGARGADAEDQVVPLDGFKVAALVDGLRRENLLAEIALLAALHQRAQRHFGIDGDDPQVAVQIAIVEDVTFAHQRVVVLQNVLGADDVAGLAFDFEIVVDQLRMDAQSGFDQPDVLVAGAKQAFDASVNTHASFH